MQCKLVFLLVLLHCVSSFHAPHKQHSNVINMVQQPHSELPKDQAETSHDQGESEGEKQPPVSDKCGMMVENYRFDCHPDGPVTQQTCEARGCCYTPGKQVKVPLLKESGDGKMNAPWCYFPPDYPSYSIDTYEHSDRGYSATLKRAKPTHWPGEVNTLKLDVIFEDRNRVHFKIYDPKNKRYEVPIETPPPPTRGEPGMGVEFYSEPFSFVVNAEYGGAPVMDTSLVGAPLIFTDQFIQFSTRLPTPYIYGLGEHKEHLLINASNGWQQRAFWARDQGPAFESNLYGVHPFYMGRMEGSFYEPGMTYGVFFLNSNAMEIDLQPMPALTFRTIGGILDFYIFYGQTPDDVIQQYSAVIGRPYLPPYWSLGFHLCRYGYDSSKRLKEIIDRNKAIGFPYDVQWSDIDYMSEHRDWSYDIVNYAGLPDIVKDLHSSDMKYVIIVDPGINNKVGYAPYDDGLKMDIFIKNSTGQPLIGRVWPGETVFPDFTHPSAADWWLKYAQQYHDQVPFDGLWTDMNEPSNMVDGSKYGCTNNTWDNPPYTPGITDHSLSAKTLCPSAQQHLGSHYNLHSMYGHFEVKASHDVLVKLNQARPFVISRSTFPSTGKYGGHWSGDISSTWEDLAYSIPEMLRFNMFAIPQVGADICGFGSETTEELCTRWMQLGAFYPFMRNHNTLGTKDQDPGAWSPAAQAAMKRATALRYSLLPQLYTLFMASHLNGTTVARPYFFVYPGDPVTLSIDEQFFWGNSLLISPVLTQGATTVRAYFNPNDTFYDVYDGTPIHQGGWQVLDAPLDKINVHVRGGSIIPTLPAVAVTTTQSRKTPFCLLVGLGVKRVAHFVPKPKPHEVYVNFTHAEGEMYWDDGVSLDTVDKMKYNHIQFKATAHNITSMVMTQGYSDPNHMTLDSIKVMGLTSTPANVMVNSKPAKVSMVKNYMLINGFTASLMEKLLVTWS